MIVLNETLNTESISVCVCRGRDAERKGKFIHILALSSFCAARKRVHEIYINA